MAELKRRAVRCKIHGLHYDPALTSGCSRCRKEGLSRTKPVFLSLLLTLLALSVVAAVVIQGLIDFEPSTARAADTADTGTNGTDGTDGADGTATTARGKVDPAPYRSQLLALEDALYDDSVTDLVVIADRVAVAAAALAAALRAVPGHRWAADEVMVFEEAVRGDDAPSLATLAQHRDRWLGLRQRLFATAPWLIRDAASPTDRLTAAATRDVAVALIELVDEAAAVDDASWSSFEETWRRRLDEIMDRMPPPPAYDTDPRLLVGRRDLDRAIAELAAFAFEGAPETVRERLDVIAERLASSRDRLEEALDA